MSDAHPPSMAPTPAPDQLYNYEIKCVNGWAIRCASPMNLPVFWKIAKADGYISADKMAINMDNVVSVEFIGFINPNGDGKVVQLAPSLQAIHTPTT